MGVDFRLINLNRLYKEYVELWQRMGKDDNEILSYEEWEHYVDVYNLNREK